jgi:thioredoxin-like negative regulator of GroEL
MNAARIADQIEQVDRDLAEVDEQVDAGELDQATADRLRSVYRTERAALEDQLSGLATASDDAPVEPSDATTHTRSRGRAIAGTAIVGIAAVAVAVVAFSSLQERTPAGESTDGVATAVLENGGGRDLSSVGLDEMEAVVAANPDIPGMRLALADRYVEAGDYSAALGHYMIVLEQEPESATALARVGWLTFLSGEGDLAEPFIVRAIAIEPDFPQAYWYLANVRVENGDPEGAIEPLERLLTYELPPEVRSQAEEMLAEVRS